jgi:dTDP-D-glucose 4,6-dehydratase
MHPAAERHVDKSIDNSASVIPENLAERSNSIFLTGKRT